MTNLVVCTSPDAKPLTNNPEIALSKEHADEFAQCVENISVLNLRLKNADERCQMLRTDLRRAKQVCCSPNNGIEQLHHLQLFAHEQSLPPQDLSSSPNNQFQKSPTSPHSLLLMVSFLGQSPLAEQQQKCT
jgi:hypothetical protein